MDKNRTGVLILLLILLKVLGPTEASCSCKDQTYCNCQLQGGNQRLTMNLFYNAISDIQPGTFKALSQLTMLVLHSNKLTRLTSNMFTGMGNLVELQLHKNNINEIQAGVFTDLSSVPTPNITVVLPSGLNVTVESEWGETVVVNDTVTINITVDAVALSQLQMLVLHSNKLTRLTSNMFTGMGNLVELQLHKNNINEIQAGTFSSMWQLSLLNLNFNKLTNLRSGMFTGLGNLKILQLAENDIITS
ncbi:PREDICTED: leucine-rich repeat-containing protein 15-like [Branchiostoma belcheri]|uniref:Leucine-rich repeat-containing protein 15-like n=1 Tax=Branchiostoma belcheri TaxID=7741 RepID=A0A6P4YWX3_BRABE|nr:PREDICTED: leucine-rich repeat-containing protein 15-like [Branchiostoma belcheri]